MLENAWVVTVCGGLIVTVIGGLILEVLMRFLYTTRLHVGSPRLYDLSPHSCALIVIRWCLYCFALIFAAGVAAFIYNAVAPHWGPATICVGAISVLIWVFLTAVLVAAISTANEM